jgi:GNAT superfamily N-acetyltransferase
MKIEVATAADVEPMVRLSEAFRSTLSGYSPVFWRKADDSFARQVAWFRIVVAQQDMLCLVARVEDELRGFAMGRLTTAPPVYAPGGPVCLIDDFCVTTDAEWPSVGAALLDAVESRARERGAVLSVIVCPHLAREKRAFLNARRFTTTAEWSVREL